MLSNIFGQRFGNLPAGLIACLGIIAGFVSLQLGLSEPARAGSVPEPIQLDIYAQQRITWTENAAEYRVRLTNHPRNFGVRQTTVRYKIIDQRDECDADVSWSADLPRNHRNIILDKWKTKPNYLFLVRNSVLKYLGHKFCFRISKAPVNGQAYLDGYAAIDIEKWWTDVVQGGVCPSVYTWIDDDQIMRGGQTTLRFKISNIANVDSVRITARNHDYWFYDTAEDEPNIKKRYGNLHEVTLTHNSATSAVGAWRTVVGHLAPRTHNLYVVQVHKAGCPVAQDAVFMRVVD